MGVVSLIFQYSTAEVLDALHKFYPRELNVSFISRYCGITRPSVYNGLKNGMELGFIKKRDASSFPLYSLYDNKVKEVLDELVDITVQQQKRRKK